MHRLMVDMAVKLGVRSASISNGGSQSHSTHGSQLQQDPKNGPNLRRSGEDSRPVLLCVRCENCRRGSGFCMKKGSSDCFPLLASSHFRISDLPGHRDVLSCRGLAVSPSTEAKTVVAIALRNGSRQHATPVFDSCSFRFMSPARPRFRMR